MVTPFNRPPIAVIPGTPSLPYTTSQFADFVSPSIFAINISTSATTLSSVNPTLNAIHDSLGNSFFSGWVVPQVLKPADGTAQTVSPGIQAPHYPLAPSATDSQNVVRTSWLMLTGPTKSAAYGVGGDLTASLGNPRACGVGIQCWIKDTSAIPNKRDEGLFFHRGSVGLFEMDCCNQPPDTAPYVAVGAEDFTGNLFSAGSVATATVGGSLLLSGGIGKSTSTQQAIGETITNALVAASVDSIAEKRYGLNGWPFFKPTVIVNPLIDEWTFPLFGPALMSPDCLSIVNADTTAVTAPYFTNNGKIAALPNLAACAYQPIVVGKGRGWMAVMPTNVAEPKDNAKGRVTLGNGYAGPLKFGYLLVQGGNAFTTHTAPGALGLQDTTGSLGNSSGQSFANSTW